MPDTLTQAREAYEASDWKRAAAMYAACGALETLSPEDLEKLASALGLLGRQGESREVLARGYHQALEAGDRRQAARFAFWVGHGLMFAGQQSQSSAWFARAKELVGGEPGCAEHGMLLVGDGIGLLGSGQPQEAVEQFRAALQTGERCGDQGLIAMASHGLGRSLIAAGRITEGMAVLDAVMVNATEGRVPPMILGELYCGVLEACHDVFDYRRAREWTAALTRWCESQPDLVPYRGPCLVHRVELLSFGGEWQDALAEAHKACAWLSEPLSPEGPGDAYYQLGELHRLRGEFAEAEAAYRDASRCGKRPEPGAALLWLARGQVEAARAAVSRALEEAIGNRAERAHLLGALVEVLLAAGEPAAAREAVKELEEIADVFGAAALRASAEAARGRVLIAEGSPAESLTPLRKAWTGWQKLDAPFEAARVRVQVGIAYRALGDLQSAAMEFDAARWVFQELGAAPELARLDAMAPPMGSIPVPGGLTARETEVLRLVARGLTNREIAANLVISEHTVARHVQNMLAKLGFPSRTRLATFAVEQGLPGENSQLLPRTPRHDG